MRMLSGLAVLIPLFIGIAAVVCQVFGAEQQHQQTTEQKISENIQHPEIEPEN